MTSPGLSGTQPLYFSQANATTRLTSNSGSFLHHTNSNSTGECNTRNMLSMLQERLNGFEKQVASEAANRKNSEENRMHAIKEGMIKLEKNLNAEIKRRVDGNKQLTQMFTQEVTMVQNKLEKLFVEKLDHLQLAIDSLGERTSKLERDFMEERDGLRNLIEEQTSASGKDISMLQATLDSEKSHRNERENTICRRIGELETKADNSIENERAARDQKYAAIVDSVEEAKLARDQRNDSFQNQTLEEMVALKNALVAESQARERADDDIVQAINHYTKALQDALRMMNST